MKVSVISRNPEAQTRARSGDLFQLPRNLDPTQHPFERAREYQRALNAAKLERIFAKPFLKSLAGHRDGVYALAKDAKHLTRIASGSADGELRVWDLASSETLWRHTFAHKGFIRAVCMSPVDGKLLSCADDRFIHLWDWQSGVEDPVVSFKGKNAFSSLSHHRSKRTFISCGSMVELWEETRTEPIHTYVWGADTYTSAAFNQTEVSVLAACGTDRTLLLFDIRQKVPLSRTVMGMKGNDVAWNPMEAFNLTVANEDHNLYTFDMRKMDQALNVHQDHVSAVLSVDYAPTGQEIVTGSYDKTIRIFPIQNGHSRDIYHTKRMQRVFSVKYSMDARYIVCGSDDGNIRLWRAQASDRVGPQAPRQRNALEYNAALMERYKHMPQLRKVLRSRSIPTAVKSAQRTIHEMKKSRRQKRERRERHSATGPKPRVPERRRAVIATES